MPLAEPREDKEASFHYLLKSFLLSARTRVRIPGNPDPKIPEFQPIFANPRTFRRKIPR